MANVMGTPSSYGLENHGVRNLNMAYWSLPTPMLVERIVHRREGLLAHQGAIVVRTGHHTGRSPNDKFIVREPEHQGEIWWGKVNRPISAEKFDQLHHRLTAYLQSRDVFVQDVVAGADPAYRMPIRVVSEYAWHSLFTRNLFIQVPQRSLADHIPEYTILHAPRFHAIPEQDDTNSEAFIIINFARKLILIGGTSYAGEIKKSIFSVLNYLLPKQGVLSMHCSANVGRQGDVALFFGLSGTGKTTLSSDPQRRLVGDDEHGWGDHGVFNFEGGCYAKTIDLQADQEPVIWQATRSFGTILENVGMDMVSREIDYTDDSLTENTRAGYNMSVVDSHVPEGKAGHPDNLFFLTADAFGVLPPISRLSPEQAMYYFLSGYTSKLAGTEKGLGDEPIATFSTCFAAPFLPLHPREYAKLLGEKIKNHETNVWLVNTGWTGGPFGKGHRINLPYTRAMVRAALEGKLEEIPSRKHERLSLQVPERCPEVPEEVLKVRETWDDQKAYDEQAEKLANQFHENFEQYREDVDTSVRSAGPRVD